MNPKALNVTLTPVLKRTPPITAPTLLSFLFLLLTIKNIYSIDQTILVHSLMLKTHFVLSFFFLLYIFLVTRFFLLLCRLASEEKDGLRQKKKKQKAGLF